MAILQGEGLQVYISLQLIWTTFSDIYEKEEN